MEMASRCYKDMVIMVQLAQGYILKESRNPYYLQKTQNIKVWDITTQQGDPQIRLATLVIQNMPTPTTQQSTNEINNPDSCT